MGGIAIGARTALAGGGGLYRGFYNAVPYGRAFATVPYEVLALRRR